MGRLKQEEGTQRSVTYRVRVKPEFDQVLEEKLADWREVTGDNSKTISDLIRDALVATYIKDGDPRRP